MPVFVVTGASRGLGAASARSLATMGGDVVVVARSGRRLDDVAQQVEEGGGRCVAVSGDVCDPDMPRRVVSAAIERFGRLDCLINNAGSLQPIQKTQDAEADAWRHLLEVNLLAPLEFMRSAIPHLRATRGKIINVTSGLAHRPAAALGAYCASKAALSHLGQVVALEEPEIVVVSYEPGRMDTDMMAKMRGQAVGAMSEEQIQLYRDLKRNGELVSPEESGRRLAWLALNARAEWSGQSLAYDSPVVAEAVERGLTA